jgi:hypothetical protein
MRLIDDSPATFITLCFVVLYTVVAVEAMMLIASSIALMVAVFALIAVVAGLICAWMFRLLDDGAPAPAAKPVAEVPAPMPSPAPVRTAPQPAGRLAHV